MKTALPAAVLTAFFVWASSFAPAAALPASLTAAEAACDIGEGSDGYLHIKTDAPSDTLVNDVESLNLQRRAHYARLADREGQSVAVIAALTAEQLIEKLEKGRCYIAKDGRWTVKD